jgi:PAS domain-containing protein
LDEKRRYSIGYRIVLPDGTVKHLESIGVPEFSATGELIEIVATQIDVTERKCAEQALRESEYKLRQIIEAVPGLIWSTGPDGEPTMPISGFWTTPERDLRISRIVVGNDSCIRRTCQKL